MRISDWSSDVCSSDLKIDKAEGHLDWREDAGALERRVRAFTPWPGAFFEVRGEKGGERVKVLAAEVRAEKGAPGRVLDDAGTIACGAGALRLLTVQRAGKAPMPIEAFLRGFALPAGTVLPGRATRSPASFTAPPSVAGRARPTAPPRRRPWRGRSRASETGR